MKYLICVRCCRWIAIVCVRYWLNSDCLKLFILFFACVYLSCRICDFVNLSHIQLLAKLDRLKLIELLPLNRFKLVVANDFRWMPSGPIQRFFRKEVLPAFMKSSFSSPGEKFLFRSGMLSRGSNAAIIKKMERLLAQFNELHDEDTALSLDDRFGSSLLIALRPWEFSYFRELRRIPDEKNF